ncbi:MAG: hypothetical protein IPH30_11625 [Betaproteobacteria bacterium]|nr:hypothetical protein [Betaproteobacteria bacterium]
MPPASTVDEEKLITPADRTPLRKLGVKNAYPVLQGCKNSVGHRLPRL